MNTKNNILKQIVDELMRDVDVSELSDEEVIKFREKTLNEFYNFIILKTIDSVSVNEREKIVDEIRKSDGDVNLVMNIIGNVVDDAEQFIADLMLEYKSTLR